MSASGWLQWPAVLGGDPVSDRFGDLKNLTWEASLLSWVPSLSPEPREEGVLCQEQVPAELHSEGWWPHSGLRAGVFQSPVFPHKADG